MKYLGSLGLHLVVFAFAFGSTAVAQDATLAKPMSHEVEARENCLMCHESGAMEATVIPESHAGRQNEQCLLCHGEGSPILTASPPTVSHEIEGREQCLMCHESGAMEAPVAPESHAGLENESCQVCHAKSG